ncbi:MAG: hypothetical protein AAGE94_21810 [Acidobacteriota bacterium]
MCLVALSGSLVAGNAAADRWLSPGSFDRQSPDGRWEAHIECGETGPTARIHDRHAQHVSTVKLHNEVLPVDAAILDGGTLVVFDEWHHMGYGDDVVVSYARHEDTGRWREIWRRSLEALLGEDGARSVPTSVSSRWWRKMPLEWQTVRDDRGAWLRVTLHDENQLDLRLTDGTSRRHDVADVGPDPDRVLRRAMSLANRYDTAAAAAELLKIWPGPETPIDDELVPRLAQALRRADQAERAVELLEPRVPETPPSPTDRDPEARRQRTLWIELAHSYTKADYIVDAEKAWRALAVGERDPWRWVQQLADLLFDIDEERQALAELVRYYRDRQSKLDDGGIPIEAASRVGSMMLNHRHPEKAVRFLAHAWNADGVDFHDGMEYARAALRTGDAATAIETWHTLRTHFADDPIYRTYRDLATDALRRACADARHALCASTSD